MAPIADAGPVVSECAAVSGLLSRARDDGQTEQGRLETWHTLVTLVRDHRCAERADLEIELDRCVKDLLDVCVVLEITGGETRLRSRTPFAALRTAIEDVGGPDQGSRHARLSRCAQKVSADNCAKHADKKDLAECMKSLGDRLFNP